jgi:hypothetical protein
MPRLVNDSDLPAANAARVGITGLCVIAGPLVGAALLLLGSAAATFAVNGASFLVPAPGRRRAPPREATRRPRRRRRRERSLGPRRPRDRLAGAARAPDALPVAGAEIVSSTVYGVLTVLLRPARPAARPRGRGLRLPPVALGAGAVLSRGLAKRRRGVRTGPAAR